MSRNIPIGKLRIELNPELISVASKNKKLDVCSAWLALRTIDKHRQGTGKFKLSTCLEIIQEITKCNKNYSYEIFKKGIDFYWNKPTGAKGNKEVYLFGIKKVVQNHPFDLAKTHPFYIKMEDLFQFQNLTELKSFLSSFVIGRYGDNKPITIKSLESNLGISSSTVKRRISNSEIISKKSNFSFTDSSFTNICEAQNYLNKVRATFKSGSSSYKIVKRENVFYIAKQIGNSYSCEDFSRGRISKRPKIFKIIDSENRDSFVRRKYFSNKSKYINNRDLIYSKIKNQNNNFNIWLIKNLDKQKTEQINESAGKSRRVKSWRIAKRWLKLKRSAV